MSEDEVLISIGASPSRRWCGIAGLAGLGVLFLWLALGPVGGLMKLLFLGFAVLCLIGAEKLRVATMDQLELTPTELRMQSGRVLTTVENVKAVERGALAFKPSNGFLVRLKEPTGRGWAPGLYWQRGRMLGVGGVIPGAQTRVMADLLAVLAKGLDPRKDFPFKPE